MASLAGHFQSRHTSGEARKQDAGWHHRRQGALQILRKEVQGRGCAEAHPAVPEERRQTLNEIAVFARMT